MLSSNKISDYFYRALQKARIIYIMTIAIDANKNSFILFSKEEL